MRYLFFVLVLCATRFGFSQDSSIIIDTVNLKRQAIAMSDAFLKKDYQAFSEYSYPKLLALMGGKSALIKSVSSGVSEMEEEGYNFKAVNVILTDKSVRAGKEIHTLLIQVLTIDVPGGFLVQKSYMIGISMDYGKRWYFLDASPLSDPAKLEAVLPNFNSALKIPAKEKALFYKSE